MKATKLEQLKQRFNEVSKRMDVSLPADRFILSLELEELKNQIKQELEPKHEAKHEAKHEVKTEAKPIKCQKPKSKTSAE